jgi:hypothetical protein
MTPATPNPADDHDLDDRVMYFEKVFSIHISDKDASDFLSQEGAVRWIEKHFPGSPNVHALVSHCRLEESQQRPGLAEGRGRSEQIAAIVSDIFMKQRLMKSSPRLGQYIWFDPARERPRKSRWRKFLPTKTSVFLFAAIVFFILLWRQVLR